MNREKLWFRHSIFVALMAGLFATALAINRVDDKSAGMILLFQSAGRAVVVQRFDLNGRSGPVPGSVGGMFPRGGAEVVLMPEDGKYENPNFVEVTWIVPSDEFDQWAKEEDQKQKGILNREQLAERQAEFQRRWAANPHYTKHIDLASIITPALVNKVRAEHQNMKIKLVITFNNNDVQIKALAYKWR